jgi:proline dehydrogenase
MLSDALAVADRVAGEGHSCTIGYWDTGKEPPRHVADEYRAGIESLARTPARGYLSIKLPSLDFSQSLVDEIAAYAAKEQVRLHFDAMWPETVDKTWRILEGLLETQKDLVLGCTLPARWRRSLTDADWASHRGLAVRVVKGQWPDSTVGSIDLQEKYLELVDRLGGRARHVSVASHDAPLVAASLERLQLAGTKHDVELLYGLPKRDVVRLAQSRGVSIRMYIPYGQAFLPYALSRARRNPRIIWWLLKDLLKPAL